MQKWEYGALICHYEAGIISGSNYWTWQGKKIELVSLEQALSERGGEGWELATSHAHVETDWSEEVYIFKRPLSPES